MNDDPIVASVRSVREELAAAFAYDVHAIFADLRRQETDLGNRLVKQSLAMPPSGSSGSNVAMPPSGSSGSNVGWVEFYEPHQYFPRISWWGSQARPYAEN